MLEWIDRGGVIMYILLFMNIVGWSTMLWKVIEIKRFHNHISKHKDNCLKMISKIQDETLDSQEKINVSIFHYFDHYYSGMNTVKIIASISPLLGLLGTVFGISSSFTVIASKGLDDPTLFASGISYALVTTVGGLIVAIPHFIGHSYLKGFLQSTEKKLEEQIIFEAKI